VKNSMNRLKITFYLKLLILILLAFVAIKFPNNDIDRIIADLIEIKSLATLAKIISLVFKNCPMDFTNLDKNHLSVIICGYTVKYYCKSGLYIIVKMRR